MKIGIDIGGSHVGIGLVDEFGNIQQKKEKYIVEKIENESQINKQNLNNANNRKRNRNKSKIKK